MRPKSFRLLVGTWVMVSTRFSFIALVNDRSRLGAVHKDLISGRPEARTRSPKRMFFLGMEEFRLTKIKGNGDSWVLGVRCQVPALKGAFEDLRGILR